MEVTQSQQEEVPPLEVKRGGLEPMFGRLPFWVMRAYTGGEAGKVSELQQGGN